MHIRIKLVSLIIITILCLSSIAYLFWQQELKYMQPTPKPTHFQLSTDKIGEVENHILNILKQNQNKDKIFVHFYNYDCPCSRFNIKEFERLVVKFREEVHFVAILETKEDMNKEAIRKFENKYGLGIPIILDKDGLIAKELGIYSTPQAMIIEKNSVFFKGNYNAARFCTNKNTRFAEIALTALINGNPAPAMPMVAEIPYGCELPSNATAALTIKSLFNF